MTEQYKTIHTRRDISLRVNVNEVLSDIIELLDGCYYGIL